MAISLTTRYRWIASFLVLTGLLGWIEYGIVTSTVFQAQPDRLAWAISADLLLGIPILYYLLIVRPLSVTPLTLVAIFLAAVGLARCYRQPTGSMYTWRSGC
ncbi:hypothetical protein [Larkinella humicola]|uniref:Uncharacterized protein n=1 Tax=Larkinella humicola TaxID=2607654 RepID=A0A5N1JAA7_9BACT|nr:hypothetical protein [Larkinella humicola]KAA9349607.1 hypothetical protein F0P93_19275 [Larkinella humicola]